MPPLASECSCSTSDALARSCASEEVCTPESVVFKLSIGLQIGNDEAIVVVPKLPDSQEYYGTLFVPQDGAPIMQNK